MGKSSVLLSSESKDRVSYNRAVINELKVNELNINNNNVQKKIQELEREINDLENKNTNLENELERENNEKLKFANKTYELKLVKFGIETFVDYIFNENSELTVISKTPSLNIEDIYIKGVKLVEDRAVKRRYISGLTKGDNDTVCLYYTMMGMVFNEDYTELTITPDINVGGPTYIFDKNKIAVRLLLLAYPENERDLVKRNIENGNLLRPTPDITGIFRLLPS